MYDNLNNENFLLYCAKYYDNPHCYDMSEFKEDMGRIKNIKKLVTRYSNDGDLRERLILNHLIILSNVFPPPHLVRILFLKAEKQMNVLKPFLLFLGILPEKIMNIGKEKKIIDTNLIAMDQNIVNVLRKI
jgi:hypothetical protein